MTQNVADNLQILWVGQLEGVACPTEAAGAAGELAGGVATTADLHHLSFLILADIVAVGG